MLTGSFSTEIRNLSQLENAIKKTLFLEQISKQFLHLFKVKKRLDIRVFTVPGEL